METWFWFKRYEEGRVVTSAGHVQEGRERVDEDSDVEGEIPKTKHFEQQAVESCSEGEVAWIGKRVEY